MTAHTTETRLLSDLTTLRIGGPATVLTLDDRGDFLGLAASIAEAGRPPICIGWGSNILVADGRIDIPVVLVRTRGIRVAHGPDHDHVLVTVEAGQSLPELVEFAAAEGFMGIETLAGIPGTVGAMPIQNVGAYGQETADTLIQLTAWDWDQQRMVTLSAAECRFGHRTSLFKRSHRWTILTLTFKLTRDRLSAPVVYSELAKALNVPLGARLPVDEINAAVLAVRRPKGMVLDPTDPDSRSVGSIFLSPVITTEQADNLRAMGASPHVYGNDRHTRVGASWLIRQAGYSLGEHLRPGVRISGKHFTLVATDDATASSFASAAAAISARVHSATGVLLRFEPDLVGDDPGFTSLAAESCNPRSYA